MYIKEVAASLYPWDLADEGIETAAENLQGRCNVNSLYLVGIMHYEKRPLTSLFFTHNPNRKYYLPEDSHVYYHLDMKSFDNTPLKPSFAEDDFLKGTDWLEVLTEEAHSRGMRAGVELSHTVYDTAKAFREFPDTLQRDVNGEIIGGFLGMLCSNHPDVREYQRAIFADTVRNHDLDYIQTCLITFAGEKAVQTPWFMKQWLPNGNPQMGSWGYTLSSPQGTGSMTCAGITSLVIASDRLQSSGAKVVGGRIECCSPHSDADAARIEKGWKWLGRNYSVSQNPQGAGWHLYYLYGLERTGRLTAQRFIPLAQKAAFAGDAEGRADWYREGSEWLVTHTVALENGVWRGQNTEGNELIGTSMALLFLSKGRWPVLMSKMQHAPGTDWNHHRADAANLTRLAESRWKQDMTWQIIDLRAATVEELVQTPVMYLSGSQDPVPEGATKRKELARKIRDYLDRGGFLFAVADCDGVGFDRGFRQLMQEVFTEPEYRLRLLEPEHPIWRAEAEIDPHQLRPVWGVEFGCRTSVAYVPPEPAQNLRPSLSCLWELSRPGRDVKYASAVQKQVDAAMMLGVNVLAYATNRELKSKENYFKPKAARGPTDRVERGRMVVATLRHPGGCSIAPRAVVNLMDAAASELKIRTKVREELLDITDDSLFDYHLVFMHGRTAFRLTDAERQRLRQFVERGGMVLADSVCASTKFTDSFRNEMKLIFPNQTLEHIPATDPLWTTRYGGYDLRTVLRRDPGGRQATTKPAVGPSTATTRRVPPDLEGVKFGDRWGVVFSQYDLSCALEKRDSLECRGYTRDDAARIGLNVVLYSLQQ